MTENVDTVQSQFHSFLKQRNNKTSDAMQMAQRLVNLYRVLGVFGSDFFEEYNKMLLNASDEVQTALTALIGGQEVRQYLEFLNSEQKKSQKETNSDNPSQQTGWLPSPEEENAAKESATGRGPYVSSREWNAFVQAEDEKLNQLVTTMKEEQSEMLKKLVNQLFGSLSFKSESPQKNDKNMGTEYSEIIEEKR